ncbi:MAG TPA: hypothetical protein VN456_06570 [Desulfosporosinus sp.]|nr:hypothetical protein [Desulfosporosinus sp.]
MNYESSFIDQDKHLAKLAVMFIGSSSDIQAEFEKFAADAYTQDLARYFKLVNDYLTGKGSGEMPGPMFIRRF